MSLLSGKGICLLTYIRTWTRSSSRAIMCPPASLHCSVDSIRYRNFNLLSIAYASPPRLRSRLTLSRRSLLRNPRAFGGKDSHLSFRYSYRHSHCLTVHISLRLCFFLLSTLPYPDIAICHSFGSVLEPRTFSAQRLSTSELLRTL